MSGVQRGGDRHPGERDQTRGPRWVEQELHGCSFKDKRLERRLRALLAQLASKPGGSIPLVSQDWANTKAAYRFLDNERIVSVARSPHGHRDLVAPVCGLKWRHSRCASSNRWQTSGVSRFDD